MPKDAIVRIFEALPKPVRSMFPYEKPWFIEFCKFVIVGIISSLLTLAILYTLTELLHIYYLYSALLAVFLAAINGYVWNHRWTFKTEGVRRHHIALPKYIGLNTLTYFINISTLAFLVEHFGVWYILAEIIAILVAMLGNFLGSKYWAFK